MLKKISSTIFLSCSFYVVHASHCTISGQLRLEEECRSNIVALKSIAQEMNGCLDVLEIDQEAKQRIINPLPQQIDYMKNAQHLRDRQAQRMAEILSNERIETGLGLVYEDNQGNIIKK